MYSSACDLMAEEPTLYLIGDAERNDYDVREGSPSGRIVGRIYKRSHAPTGLWWLWAVQIFPADAHDNGSEATRQEAMAALKAQWLNRYEAWDHWVGPKR